MAAFCLSGLALATGPPGVWLDVPFVQQEKNGCGAASVSMVMRYWRQKQGRAPDGNADAGAIQRALYSQRAHGIFASELQRYLQQNGFRTFASRGELKDLRNHLQQGRPLIVALKPAGAAAPLHYVVIAGIDWEESVVIVNDPAQRKLLKREWPTFEQEWKAADNWTLLAVPQQVAR